jgi:hypothetical protein
MPVRNQVRLGTKADNPIRHFQVQPAKRHHLLEKQIGRLRLGQVNDLYLVPLIFEYFMQPLNDISISAIDERYEC